MKNHKCFHEKYCSCSIVGLEPDEECEIHGYNNKTKKCDICGRFFRNRPIIVCLCGSTRFRDAFIEANRKETLEGKIVLSVGLYGHFENLDMSGETKKMLDELHRRKIELADEVYFLNVNGYIGDSTKKDLLVVFCIKEIIILGYK